MNIIDACVYVLPWHEPYSVACAWCSPAPGVACAHGSRSPAPGAPVVGRVWRSRLSPACCKAPRCKAARRGRSCGRVLSPHGTYSPVCSPGAAWHGAYSRGVALPALPSWHSCGRVLMRSPLSRGAHCMVRVAGLLSALSRLQGCNGSPAPRRGALSLTLPLPLPGVLMRSP